MNNSVAKKLRRNSRKTERQFSEAFVREVQGLNLAQRLKFCWTIIRIKRR